MNVLRRLRRIWVGNGKALLSVTELNLMKMNKEQMLKRLAMNIVSQLFDLADVPVEKRQAVNDEADSFVLRLLQQCSVSGSLPFVHDVIEIRIKHFESIQHTYEAGELKQALSTIQRLIPPIMFDIGGNDR